jgi:hypothetical protein
MQPDAGRLHVAGQPGALDRAAQEFVEARLQRIRHRQPASLTCVGRDRLIVAMFQRILPLIAAAGLASLCVPPARADRITPTPRATALPVTATNRPFLGAATALQPVDLAARGYVESEYLVSGLAGVYDWAETGARQAARPRPSPVPYTTRLLLRRPADPKRFSGRVIVELLSAAGGYDTAPLWGLSSEHFLRHGDAWAGLTVKPAAAEALRRFDPLRYTALNFAMTQPPDCGVLPVFTPSILPVPRRMLGF